MTRPDLPKHFKIIGLTGPSGAGKGEIASRFAARGIDVIDADAVYHALLCPPSPCLDALVAEFGSDILTSEGCLDRHALASLVFGDSPVARTRRARLNEISHAFVTDHIFTLLQKAASRGLPAAVIDAPLLIEAGLDTICDVTVAVLAPRHIRLERLLRRDGRSESELNARLDAQPSDDFYTARATMVIHNDGVPELLDAAVAQALTRAEVCL